MTKFGRKETERSSISILAVTSSCTAITSQLPSWSAAVTEVLEWAESIREGQELLGPVFFLDTRDPDGDVEVHTVESLRRDREAGLI